MEIMKKLLKNIILVSALCILSSTVATVQAGEHIIHTLTLHPQNVDLTPTPGFGYATDDGARFGVLYNTFKLPSYYVAHTYDISSRFRIGLGLMSGYLVQDGEIINKRSGFIPFTAVEADITDHISVVWMGNVFNLELKF